jgi:hypothetical protein
VCLREYLGRWLLTFHEHKVISPFLCSTGPAGWTHLGSGIICITSTTAGTSSRVTLSDPKSAKLLTNHAISSLARIKRAASEGDATRRAFTYAAEDIVSGHGVVMDFAVRFPSEEEATDFYKVFRVAQQRHAESLAGVRPPVFVPPFNATPARTVDGVLPLGDSITPGTRLPGSTFSSPLLASPPVATRKPPAPTTEVVPEPVVVMRHESSALQTLEEYVDSRTSMEPPPEIKKLSPLFASDGPRGYELETPAVLSRPSSVAEMPRGYDAVLSVAAPPKELEQGAEQPQPTPNKNTMAVVSSADTDDVTDDVTDDEGMDTIPAPPPPLASDLIPLRPARSPARVTIPAPARPGAAPTRRATQRAASPPMSPPQYTNVVPTEAAVTVAAVISAREAAASRSTAHRLPSPQNSVSSSPMRISSFKTPKPTAVTTSEPVAVEKAAEAPRSPRNNVIGGMEADNTSGLQPFTEATDNLSNMSAQVLTLQSRGSPRMEMQLTDATIILQPAPAPGNGTNTINEPQEPQQQTKIGADTVTTLPTDDNVKIDGSKATLTSTVYSSTGLDTQDDALQYDAFEPAAVDPSPPVAPIASPNNVMNVVPAMEVHELEGAWFAPIEGAQPDESNGHADTTKIEPDEPIKEQPIQTEQVFVKDVKGDNGNGEASKGTSYVSTVALAATAVATVAIGTWWLVARNRGGHDLKDTLSSSVAAAAKTSQRLIRAGLHALGAASK